MKKAVIASLLAVVLPAYADVVIDFAELAPGTVLTNQYESMYGINFNGSVVQQAPSGYNYVSGGKMTFAPHNDFRLTFNAVGQYAFDPADTWVKGERDGQAFQEPIHVGGVDAWKECAPCSKYTYGSIWNAIHGYSFTADPATFVHEVDFNTVFLANIHFTSGDWSARLVDTGYRPATQELPAPSVLLLIGLGAVIMARELTKKSPHEAGIKVREDSPYQTENATILQENQS